MNKRRYKRCLAGCLISLAVIVFLFSPAFAGAPTDRVRKITDKILDIVTDPVYKDASKLKERNEKMRKVADELFDWEEMARRSLARHWQQRTEQEKKEFVSLFADLLERTYMGKVEGYAGEKVAYTAETIDGDYASVEVKVTTSKGSEISVVNKLRSKGNEWMVYDAYIEGVSLVNNYREQFNSILASSSYQGLVKKLKEKAPEK